MIQNIGNKEPVLKISEGGESEIPLPNGTCAKPISSGKCTYANACYTCAMFKPDPNNIELFEYQLSEAKGNVEMAKINDYERILQVNEDLVLSLEKIIDSIKGEGAWYEKHNWNYIFGKEKTEETKQKVLGTIDEMLKNKEGFVK